MYSRAREIVPMVASSLFRPARAGQRWSWLALAGLPLAGVAVCWWLTAPLEDDAPVRPSRIIVEAGPAGAPILTGTGVPPAPRDFPEWPERALGGEDAKRRLLDTLLL